MDDLFNIPETMRAMVLEAPKTPLVLKILPTPVPSERQVLIQVIACGVCRTDLHVVDHELAQPKLPLIPGHEIVGMIVQRGTAVTQLKTGDYVGVPWLGYTCGTCKYCLRGQENLCPNAGFTGYTLDGGYAEYTVADERYVFPIDRALATPNGAPLMCAGLIGYRSYGKVPPHAVNIGIYGFGGAAHILIQVARHQHKNIYAFTRDGDTRAQQFALSLGAVWAGSSAQPAPEKLDAAILFAPAGELIPKALQDVDRGGKVICGGIHMSPIPSFSYDLLWEERSVESVANLTRRDGTEFLKLATESDIHTDIVPYPLASANEALNDLRQGRFTGAAVLVMHL